MRDLLFACSMLVLAAALCGCTSMRHMAYVLTPDEGAGASRDAGAIKVFGAIMDDMSVDFEVTDPALKNKPPQRPYLLSGHLQRRIIYTGRFAVDVPDVEVALKTVAETAGKLGGYVQKQTNDTIIIRVPVARFREVVRGVEQLGVVREKSIDAQDVTERYMDLKLRLDARTAYLDQLKKMLANVKDMQIMLQIQRELSKTVEEIESLKGKLRYLTSQVRLSTISIVFGKVHGRGERSFHLPFPWLSGLGLDSLLD